MSGAVKKLKIRWPKYNKITVQLALLSFAQFFYFFFKSFKKINVSLLKGH